MTALVTKHLPLVAGAPDGIKQLRALILELAVQGRLLPQSADDAPAAELLKHIQGEKTQLQKAGLISKARPHSPIDEDERPFSLPTGWRWARFQDFALDVATGPFGSLIHQSDYVVNGVPLINPSHMVNGRIAADMNVSLSPEMADQLSSYKLQTGDIVMARRGEVGRVALVTEKEAGWLCGTGSFILRFSADVSRAYVRTLFTCDSTRRYLAGAAVGTTMVNLNHGILLRLPVAVPPLAEQHRIVAKVDELMAMCDRLEADQADAEAAHAQLVQALLGSLTQATDDADFRASWQLLSEHFHTLFTTEASIDALKQTVLQLAVMGKLVSQSPLDEPASDLLIRTRNATAKAAKASSRDTPLPVNLPFELPGGWAWARFNDLIAPEFPIAYGVLVPGPDSADGVPFVRIADLDLVAPKPLPEKRISPEVDAQFARTKLRGGEILMGVVGSIGKLGLAPASWAGANIARAVCRIVPTSAVSTPYVLWLLQTQFMRQQFLGDTRTLAQPTLNVGLIRDALTPVPPLAEQHRIVAKVDELMALCDQLKAQLAEARQQHAQLATVLVEQAVA